MYHQAAQLATFHCWELAVEIFSYRSLRAEFETIENTLKNANVFFASLVYDYSQVIWLRERARNIPIRLVFESALEFNEFDSVG